MKQLFKKFQHVFGITASESAYRTLSERPSPYVIDLRKKWVEEIARSVYDSQRQEKDLPR